MQLYQPRDVVDELSRIAELLHALSRHLRPDDVVVVEVDPAWADRTGGGLADVVEERREAQGPVRAGLLDYGDGVGKDVLVALDRVLLEGERGKLGNELLGEPRVDEEPEALGGHREDEQLVQLVADALSGDDLEARRHRLHGRHELRLGV